MKTILAVLTLLAVALCAHAADYRYISQDDFKKRLESGKPLQIIDIQTAADFNKHHFRGALETDAFPAKSVEERRRLDGALERVRGSAEDIVIICPRGGGGAKNTFDYLREKGVPASRMYILEKGMEGWPYPALTVTGKN